jgi:hypothetical protein
MGIEMLRSDLNTLYLLWSHLDLTQLNSIYLDLTDFFLINYYQLPSIPDFPQALHQILSIHQFHQIHSIIKFTQCISIASNQSLTDWLNIRENPKSHISHLKSQISNINFQILNLNFLFLLIYSVNLSVLLFSILSSQFSFSNCLLHFYSLFSIFKFRYRNNTTPKHHNIKMSS